MGRDDVDLFAPHRLDRRVFFFNDAATTQIYTLSLHDALPIGAIHYAKDSTLAMLLAAQASGFALAYLELRDLLLRDGVAFGRTRALTVRPDPAGWFTLGEPAIEPLAALDCILMRKDPPFDTEYI